MYLQNKCFLLQVCIHYFRQYNINSNILGQILNKRRASLSENMMNAIMCSKAWLRFHEIAPGELGAEEQVLAHLNEVTAEGDLPIVLVDDVPEDGS